MRSATADPVVAAARLAKASAVRQVLSTRAAPEFKTHTFAGLGDAQVQVAGGEFKTPSTVAEWCSRTMAQCPTDPVGSSLILLLEAARTGGTKAAVAAVPVADRLSAYHKSLLWNEISKLDTSVAEVTAVIAGIKREWRQLRLPTQAPVTVNLEVNRPRFNSEAGGTQYSPGVPDWMIPEGCR